MKDSVDQLARAYEPGDTPSPPPPSEADLIASFDFHRVVSFLSSHAEVMRRLGLIFDLEVPFDGAIATDGSGRVQEVRLLPEWSPSVPSFDHRPTTAYVLDDDRFLAAPRAPDGPLRNGLVRFDDTTRFRIEQFDVDGGVRKLKALLATVDGLEARIAAGHTLGTDKDAGLPTSGPPASRWSTRMCRPAAPTA